MLGPEFRRDGDGQTGGESDVDSFLVHALRVHIDFDAAAAAHGAIENGLPEIVAAFGDAAFAVDAERNAADCGAGLEQRGERVATIGGVGFGR